MTILKYIFSFKTSQMVIGNRTVWTFYLLLILGSGSAEAQTLFNILPPSDGQTNQSRMFDCISDSNYIFVIGDLLDTTINPMMPEVRPWYSVYNYQGEQISRNVIYNASINGLMAVSTSNILKNRLDKHLFSALLYQDDLPRSILVEIDYLSGMISNYVIIMNPYDTLDYIFPGPISKSNYSKGLNLMVNQIEVNGLGRMYFAKIDTLLNIESQFVVNDNGRNNYAYFIEEIGDSIFIIIGESWKRNDMQNIPDVKLFYMKVNELGEVLEFKFGKNQEDYSVVFSPSDAFNVIKDKSGNYIINAQIFIPNGSSPNGFYTLPISFSYSNDFETLNWTTSLSEDVEDIRQRYALYSTNYDTISNTYAVLGIKLNQEDKNSFIASISDQGKINWIRHYLPLNWNPEEVAWPLLRDIKSTTYNSYVTVGHASQLQPGHWRSWMMHIDSFGCYIPGCQSPVSVKDELRRVGKNNFFSLFPNPCTTNLGLLALEESKEELIVDVIDVGGATMIKERFKAKFGYQYFIDTSHLISGTYVLRVYTEEGNILQTEKVVKI